MFGDLWGESYSNQNCPFQLSGLIEYKRVILTINLEIPLFYIIPIIIHVHTTNIES